jgi:hypothetical protein
MSFVSTQPAELSAAAENLQGIGSAMTAQNAAVAAPTTGVLPAAADAAVRRHRHDSSFVRP